MKNQVKKSEVQAPNTNEQKKVSSKDNLLLKEAARRIKQFHNGDINSWCGLGYPREYRSRFFVAFDGVEQPRVNNWYILTEAGKQIINQYL